MTRIDTFVVGTLVVLLALVAGIIGAPALQPASASPSAPSGALASPLPAARPYVEGVIGAPVSVSPLTAMTQVDRDLVALTFAGLVRNGPSGTIVPDLARSWSTDATGSTWTVTIRDDARWHDGVPITAEDVLFTIRTLQDPAYAGPSGTSWREVTVTALDEHTVRFALATPLGGFLQALTQPLAPAHLLADIPVDLLPDHPFGEQPVGSGPFALVELSSTSASLVPATTLEAAAEAPTLAPSGRPSDSLTTAPPTLRPGRPLPYLAGIDFRFYTDPDALIADYRAGRLDAASGLPPTLATDLAADADSRLLRYPGATLTTVLLNLRSVSHPEFALPAVRTALLAAIDREGLITYAFADAAVPASDPIPPSSPMFDATADPPVAFDRTAATKALRAAGWTKKSDGWRLPNAKEPLAIEVLSPTKGTNPGLFAAAERVVADWAALGLGATHVPLPAGEFVTQRLTTGDFAVAVADVTIGLDPDLYPLLASSQTLTGGSNVMGVQDPALDAVLINARRPGTEEQRKKAYAALQQQLARGRYLLPLAFADEVVVARDTLQGPVPRQVSDRSDRFWDVLTWRLAGDR